MKRIPGYNDIYNNKNININNREFTIYHFFLLKEIILYYDLVFDLVIYISIIANNLKIPIILCLTGYTLIFNNNKIFSTNYNKYGIIQKYNKCNKFKKINYFLEEKIISILECDNDTLLLTENGNLYVIGENMCGKLCVGHGSKVTILTKVNFFNNMKIIQIASGYNHTMILTNKGLFGVGDHHWGQLGLSETEINNYPINSIQKINFFNDKKIVSIYCGYRFTIILTDDNSLFVMGNNEKGQLGLSAKKIITPEKNNFFNNMKIISISCGFSHILILTDNGLYNMGRHDCNQLGTMLNIYEPTKINFFNNMNIISISCGNSYSLVLTDKGLFGIGSNIYGRLGLHYGVNYIDSAYHTDIPLKIPLPFDVISISAGTYHSIIVSKNGDLYSTGYNAQGQLGLKDTKDRYEFTKIDFKF